MTLPSCPRCIRGTIVNIGGVSCVNCSYDPDTAGARLLSQLYDEELGANPLGRRRHPVLPTYITSKRQSGRLAEAKRRHNEKRRAERERATA